MINYGIRYDIDFGECDKYEMKISRNEVNEWSLYRLTYPLQGVNNGRIIPLSLTTKEDLVKEIELIQYDFTNIYHVSYGMHDCDVIVSLDLRLNITDKTLYELSTLSDDSSVRVRFVNKQHTTYIKENINECYEFNERDNCFIVTGKEADAIKDVVLRTYDVADTKIMADSIIGKK